VAAKPERLSLVYAMWCPHCAPISLDRSRQLAQRLNVPLRLLDIDQPEEEQIADELVRSDGDWSEDYLIPQIFLEWDDGQVTHLLTGVPGPVEGTARRWDELLARPIRRPGG
jgi:thiol-disulfide isomerase/thioredoxin